jgi:hypothetical protein
MHPLTLYDMATREHERATRERVRDHLLRLRMRERAATGNPSHPNATAENPRFLHVKLPASAANATAT